MYWTQTDRAYQMGGYLEWETVNENGNSSIIKYEGGKYRVNINRNFHQQSRIVETIEEAKQIAEMMLSDNPIRQMPYEVGQLIGAF